MTCIPNHKYCDDISDCPDSSDEMACPTTVSYTAGQKIKKSPGKKLVKSNKPRLFS